MTVKITEIDTHPNLPVRLGCYNEGWNSSNDSLSIGAMMPFLNMLSNSDFTWFLQASGIGPALRSWNGTTLLQRLMIIGVLFINCWTVALNTSLNSAAKSAVTWFCSSGDGSVSGLMSSNYTKCVVVLVVCISHKHQCRSYRL